jgi:hypothetical protein
MPQRLSKEKFIRVLATSQVSDPIAGLFLRRQNLVGARRAIGGNRARRADEFRGLLLKALGNRCAGCRVLPTLPASLGNGGFCCFVIV